MSKLIQLKISADVPDGADPKFVASQVLQQMALRSDRLESWQAVTTPVGDSVIGECHFEVITDDDEDDSAADHEAEQARITAEWEARAAPHLPRPVTNPKRFYVTLTWDDWPEGGSYGTVVAADNAEDAEHAAWWEMANQREEFEHPADCIDAYGNQWHLVDCWDLDDFLASHTPEPVATRETTKTVTVRITFNADQCEDCTPEDYDPHVNLKSVLEYGAQHYNIEDWHIEEHASQPPPHERK